MNRFPSLQIDFERMQNRALSGQGRFILLILVFNVLLIVTLFLSMQQRELIEEYEWVVQTRTIIERQVVTLEAIEPVTITKIVQPGSVPTITPAGP